MATRAQVLPGYNYDRSNERPRRQIYFSYPREDAVVVPRKRTGVGAMLAASAVLASTLMGGVIYGAYRTAPAMAATEAPPLTRDYSPPALMMPARGSAPDAAAPASSQSDAGARASQAAEQSTTPTASMSQGAAHDVSSTAHQPSDMQREVRGSARTSTSGTSSSAWSADDTGVGQSRAASPASANPAAIPADSPKLSGASPAAQYPSPTTPPDIAPSGASAGSDNPYLE